MRAVIQRTLYPAKVTVDGKITGKIDKGLIIYLGIGQEDSEEDIKWISKKISKMRIFSDEAGKMNLSVEDLKGGLLVISQFTLYASTKKGNRPSYMRSASPEKAVPLYEAFLDHLRVTYNIPVATGIFGADMQVVYENNGPVTILLDSHNKE